MKLKRGSVTPVDLTGQLPGDYIRNDAGVYKPKTAGNVVRHLIIQDQWDNLPPSLFGTTAVSGTGSTAAVLKGTFIASGTTAGSTAKRETHPNAGWSVGRDARYMDWSKAAVFYSVITASATTTNGRIGGFWGIVAADAIGDPARKGIGWRFDGNALKGLAHNGTTLTVIDLSYTQSGFNAAIVAAVSDGAGNVDFYVNGVYKATTALGATGLSDKDASSIRYWTLNGADAAASSLYLQQTKVFIAQ